MDSQDWKRVRDLFETALDLPEADRAAFLEASTAPDSVRREALNLLRASRENVSAFDPPTPTPHWAAPPTAGVDVERGATIGQYTVERRIGTGGMADVFAATQERPARRVALKILRGGLSERAIKRFQFEAEVLGQLAHPAIAQVFDAGETELEGRRVPYIAMEYVDGAEDVISFARRATLDRDARLRLFLELCEAIQYGHERGVLHRDIKPSNLLVSAEGHCKVIDYGIARAEQEAPGRDHTLTGEVFGTLGYLAPERLRGDHAADTRGDVYSLGVVLFELLTGRMPVDLKGRSLVEAIQQIERHDPPRPSRLVPGLPEGLDWIALQALAVERERRYASVAELSDDVRRFLAGEAVQAGAPSTSYRVRSWLRRHRVLTALVLLATLGTVATIVGTSIGLQRAEEEAALARAATLSAEREARAAERQANLSNAALSILEDTLKKANATQGGVDARISVVLEAIDREVDARFAEEPEIATRMDTLLAAAYLGSRDVDDARRVLARAEARGVEIAPYHGELQLARAFLHQLEGNLPAAEEGMRAVIDALQSQTDTRSQSKRLEAVRGLTGILLSQGRFPDAVALTEEHLAAATPDLSPHSRASFFRLRSDALRMNGQIDAAVQAVEEAIRLARGQREGTYELITSLRSAGVIELRRSRTEPSLAYLEEAAQLALDFLGEEHPETALTEVILSDVYVRDGHYQKALEAFDRIEALPAYARMTLRNRVLQADTRAYVLMQLGRFEEALASSHRAVSMMDENFAAADPIRLSCEAMRARLLIRVDRKEEGFERLEALVATAENVHGAGSRLAVAMQQDWLQALMNDGQFERALQVTEAQVESMRGTLAPDHSQLWNARQVRIEALIRLQRLEDAQAAIDELRGLVDLSQAPGRQQRVDGLEAMLRAHQK